MHFPDERVLINRLDERNTIAGDDPFRREPGGVPGNMTGNRTAAYLFSTLHHLTFRIPDYPGRCAFSSVQHVHARCSPTRGFSILSLVLLLRQKIGTFDQAKRLIFVYDSVEEPDA